jgi:DNA-binding MarR family transcriptional regulator
MELTNREMQIVDILRKGTNTPTNLAEELGISQSGATQALQKLEKKGIVGRSRIGRNAIYRVLEVEKMPQDAALDEDLELIRESYHALSMVWSHVLRLDLTQDELAKVREARNMLEDILVSRGRSLD